MVKVRIFCPECNKKGYVEVRDNLMEDCKRGVSAVNIESQSICNHSFIVYIDKQFIMRDAFSTDFTVELPEINLSEDPNANQIIDSEKIDKTFISLNLHALTLSYILRACFNDKKVLLIDDSQLIKDHLENFFNFIYKDTFKVDVSAQTSEYYKKNKNLFKNHIIIDNNTLLNKKKNQFNIGKIKIEKIIVEKFLGELNPKISLVIMRNEIKKAYTLAKEIIHIKDHLKKDEVLTSKLMIDHFKQSHSANLSKEYLDFISEIAQNYFKVNFEKARGSMDLINYFK